MILSLVVTKKDPAVDIWNGGRIRCPKCAWEPAKSDSAKLDTGKS